MTHSGHLLGPPKRDLAIEAMLLRARQEKAFGENF